jgi:hypothetical protein
MTTLWTFLLAPLLVLPMVLLFRFVGCGLIYDFDDFDTSPPRPPVPEPVPNYRNYIMGRQPTLGSVLHPEVVPHIDNVIGYWRLIDASDSEKAVDEKRAFEGIYRTSPDPDLAPGDFGTGRESLLDSAPELHPRFFDGGFVVVPDDGGLHTEQFTIEAWIEPNFAPGAQRTLFHAGGEYTRPGDSVPGKHGFRVYATEKREWQVDFGSHGAVFPSPPLILDNLVRTHLAVMVEKAGTPGTTTLTMVIDGRGVLKREVTEAYSPPREAPLLIGVKSEESDPRDVLTKPQPNLSGSIRSIVQEVVLHSKVLSIHEIQNHIDINRKPMVKP